MRSRQLIENGSVCEGDFNGNATNREELTEESHTLCRFFPHDCPVARNPQAGPYCIPRAGLEVARYVIKDRTTVEQELEDFAKMAPFPPKGFFDPTRQEIGEAITDKTEIMRRIAAWTNHILGIQPIDSATVNNEFKVAATSHLIDTYPVLKESVFDEENSIWIHQCGTILVMADVIHQIRYKAMPLAGPGRVDHETVPYCADCNEVPSQQGEDYYVEDIERREADILRRFGDQTV